MKLPSGWEAKRLRTLITINYGKGLPERERKTGSFFVFGANGPVGNHNEAFTKGQTLIIGRKGSVGAVNWSEHACWPIDTTYYIDEFPQNLDKRYLYYFLKSQPLSSMDKSAAIPGLNRNDLYNVEIPIPFPSNIEYSINFQRQIVARIEALVSEVREMREINQRIQADVDHLMDSIYEETFPDQHDRLPEGWKIKTFNDICLINPRRPQIRREANVPTSFVPMSAVDEKTGAIVDLQIKPFSAVRTGFTYFEENDVLFAKITPSMQNGKSAIARNLIDGLGFGSTEFHVLRANPGILPEWIYHFIRRKRFRKEAMLRFRGAAGQQRVPQDFLEQHIIPVPFPNDPEKSIAVQKRLIAYFDSIRNDTVEMQDTASKNSDHLDQLESAILAQAFRGEL